MFCDLTTIPRVRELKECHYIYQHFENFIMIIQELDSKLIASSTDNLLIFDFISTSSQSVKISPPNLPPNLTKGQLEVLNKEDRTITSIAISRDKKFIAVATENKQVVVYDSNLSVLNNFIVNRTASKIVFSCNGDLLVADRTGDVFLYKIISEKSEPILLLGHLSMILDMVLSDCGKYVITCDRDEKIRVSCFPNTYNIVSYCLGHEEFVTSLKIIQNLLVSAAGDGTVRFWDYLNGNQLNVINTNQFIDNVKLVEAFSEQMDKEKVDVNVLPIVDMQVYCQGKCLTLAVSLYSYNAIQIYRVMLDTCDWNYVRKIEVSEHPFKFYLNSNLYIFDEEKVITYQFSENGCVQIKCPEIDNFYKKLKDILKFSDNNSITFLYKRKYDNVQEYLERKKLRLESGK